MRYGEDCREKICAGQEGDGKDRHFIRPVLKKLKIEAGRRSGKQT